MRTTPPENISTMNA